MQKLVSLLSLVILTACGGGGSSVSLGSLEITTPNPPVSTSVNNFNIHEHVNKITVIDGYVEGANVYVDLNFNGVQDENEQSAFWTGVTEPFQQCVMADENGCTQEITVDPPDNYYWFLDKQTVEDYNYGKKLIRSEVPIGAYDSERGYVETAYEMAYIPFYEYGGWRPDVDFNITPFLSLLEYFIEELNVQPFPFNESCNAYANDLMSELLLKMDGVMNQLSDAYGIDPIYFYDDFILNGDTDKQTIAENVVDILSTAETLKSLIQDNVNSPLKQYMGEGMIDTVLSNPNFTSLETDIFYEEDGSITIDNFQQILRFYFHNITIDGDGNLLDRNNQPMSMDLVNVVASADFYEESLNLFAENYIDDDIDITLKDSIIQDYDVDGNIRTVEEEIILFSDRETNSQFDRQVSLNETSKQIRIRDWYTDQPTLNTVLIIKNASNNLLNYDIENIVMNGDLTQVMDLYSELSAIPKGIDNVNTLQSYIYGGDELQIEKVDTTYTYVYSFTTVGEYCLTLDNATRNTVSYTSGNNSLNECLTLIGD